MGLNRNQFIAIGIIFLIIIFYGGYRYGQAGSNNEGLVIELAEAGAGEKLEVSEAAKEINIEGEKEIIAVEEATIYVHITGAVKKPGLYQLSEGARVNDGVILAIPTEEANLDALNLAQVLVDGNKIIVPTYEESGDNSTYISGGTDGYAAGTGSAGQTGNVNINSADENELAAKLPGIGPVLARRIIDYRNANDPFQAPQDITRVSGIGPKTYENMEDLITVR